MSRQETSGRSGGEFDAVAAIAEHSAGFAKAAEGNLGATVEHCPDWTVADLVRHLTEVHWFWGTIAGEQLSSPPAEDRRPAPVPDDEAVAVFRTGADRLTGILRAADPGQRVWTWAPAQQDIAFITRHQVQEAAVHHWDAAHAAGRDVVIATPVAADAVAEFLTFSVSSEADPADPPRPALDGAFALRMSDVGQESALVIRDGAIPGTVAFEHAEQPTVPAITATASDLLLWLYKRVELDTSAVPAEVVARFRDLCFTD